jgi:hypothetical protein
LIGSANSSGLTKKALANDGGALPAVSYSHGPTNQEGRLLMFGREFITRYLPFPFEQGVYGVIAVYLATPLNDEKLMWHTFFDFSGNVRDKPNDTSSHYNITDDEVIQKFLGEIADDYFANLTSTFTPK